jgi:hypothetical protein
MRQTCPVSKGLRGIRLFGFINVGTRLPERSKKRNENRRAANLIEYCRA